LIVREILHHNDVERVWAEKNENVGFNAVTEEFEDLVKARVIDPTNVTRTALQNAASIAGLMLTTEVMISELPELGKAHALLGGAMVF
jgi:chaperonin GroEL